MTTDEKLARARRRALRAASVLTIAGALAGGCSQSHGAEARRDGSVIRDANAQDANIRDVGHRDVALRDASFRDTREADAKTCSIAPEDITCNCIETTQACCPQEYGLQWQDDGRCCGICVGPLVPPSMLG